MGYVHDTHMSRFIHPMDFGFSAGTWTPGDSENLYSIDRSAADASFTAYIPIPLLSNASAYKGTKLKSIDVYYAIATAAADDFATVELSKMTLGPDDTMITGETVATTEDTGHDSAAERKAVDSDHVMTITLDTPAWIDDGEAYWLKLVVDCAATTEFFFFGARANYELRV